MAIMTKMPLMPRAAIATAGFAGLSKAEMQGLRWEDRKNGCWYVRRNVWSGIVKDTKTVHRAAPVPIIPQFAEVLDEYWESRAVPSKAGSGRHHAASCRWTSIIYIGDTS